MEPVIPYLLQTVEKATHQQSLTLLVTEALYASVLLCKADGVEFKKSENYFFGLALCLRKCSFS